MRAIEQSDNEIYRKSTSEQTDSPLDRKTQERQTEKQEVKHNGSVKKRLPCPTQFTETLGSLDNIPDEEEWIKFGQMQYAESIVKHLPQHLLKDFKASHGHYEPTGI